MLLASQNDDPEAAADALTRAGVGLEDGTIVRGRTAALALGSLSPLALRGLEFKLSELVRRLEIRMNPLADDLDDTAPEADLVDLARLAAPGLTACDGVASSRHASGDRKLVASVVRTCPASLEPGVTCVPLWHAASAADGSNHRRARFFAWSLASAGVLAVGGAAARDDVVEALSARSLRTDSTVAVALTEETLVGRDGAAFEHIRALARRALEILRASPAIDTRLLQLIAQGPPPGRLVPWVRLEDDEVLVVPRLDAVGDVSRLTNEVESELSHRFPKTAWRWIVRPTGAAG